jgi:hypothetical protein
MLDGLKRAGHFAGVTADTDFGVDKVLLERLVH